MYGLCSMRVFSFHLMPYPALPDDYDGPAWITCPNSLFDPGVGTQIYKRYLDELIMAEPIRTVETFVVSTGRRTKVRMLTSG